MVAQSSTEAEYIALGTCFVDLMWIRNLLLELNIVNDNPINVFEDDQSTVALARCVKVNRAKAVDVKYHLCPDLESKHIIKIKYVCNSNQIADILTKTLPHYSFNILCNRIFVIFFMCTGLRGSVDIRRSFSIDAPAYVNCY